MSYQKTLSTRGAPAAATGNTNGRNASQVTQKKSTESRQEETDHQAIERGEDEGMIVHQSVTSSTHTTGVHTNAIAAR